MEERRVTIKDHLGNTIEGTFVPITQSKEAFSELTLEDGTTLRIKPVPTRAVRYVEKWDNEGNPIYNVSVSLVVVIDNVLPDLKRKP